MKESEDVLCRHDNSALNLNDLVWILPKILYDLHCIGLDKLYKFTATNLLFYETCVSAAKIDNRICLRLTDFLEIYYNY